MAQYYQIVSGNYRGRDHTNLVLTGEGFVPYPSTSAINFENLDEAKDVVVRFASAVQKHISILGPRGKVHRWNWSSRTNGRVWY